MGWNRAMALMVAFAKYTTPKKGLYIGKKKERAYITYTKKKQKKENGRKERPKLSINRYRHSKFLGKGSRLSEIKHLFINGSPLL